MLIYRLCKQRYSAAVLSGDGGMQADGRWHSMGRPIVYCATSESLAVLELRVHVGNWLPKDVFVMHELELPDKQVTSFNTASLPGDWNAVPHAKASQTLGDVWLEKCGSLALRVPSIHSNTDFNVLINPLHPRMEIVKLQRTWPYRFDVRLFSAVPSPEPPKRSAHRDRN